MALSKLKIGIVGLGYVGLPLAVEFGKKFSVIGFDLNKIRIDELNNNIDSTKEISSEELKSSKKNLSFVCNPQDLSKCNVYIITVPTPIDKSNQPDLAPLKKATEMISHIIKRGDTIIYESTVYPGVTEEICLPIIEKNTGMTLNDDFFIGYSPERINPGDKTHRLKDIIKVTSGSNKESSEFIDKLYSSIISAGTFKAKSIKVAEAAKVIENTQRDINIALMNELSIIFNKLNIDTNDVLDAASTKWNFLPFKPGLVGGHCIGVDPYYLTHKAQSIGYHPEIILAGRRLNDSMSQYVSDQLIKKMLSKKIHVKDANVLILGITFKENCPDLRNSKVIDVVSSLSDAGINVDVYDPWVDADLIDKECGIKLIPEIKKSFYDCILLAVPHDEFKKMGYDEIKRFGKSDFILFDLKGIFLSEQSSLRL